MKARVKDGTQTAIQARRRAPGRPKNVERESRDQTREQLLDASIVLFARHGFDAVTTGQIAEAAGVTQSMVHYHFGSKSKLWEEAMARLMHRRGRLFRAQARDLIGLDPVEKLKALIRRLVEANAENPDYVRIVVQEGTTPTPRLKWLVETYLRPGFGVFDQALREAMDAGAIPRRPIHDVTNAITSAASLSFALHAVVEDLYGVDLTDPERVRSFADTIVDVIFAGLLARPAARVPVEA
ncbi:TetR/AcrR family transcriptional regulator [Phreatobacter oligotrophus]|uniref:TetR family transcriptional regulator n=1 Tax=Phreatobacter oligotrophus TaxID=1122261 RepID=A0A2T4Z5W8_9HYPH|nr:TetR/AcrR family transcriptional regulator [Phreatobacter oligotrophus]PTM57284.1 TetR family transcriptional regulator [Phreatobacter oligotrophus]